MPTQEQILNAAIFLDGEHPEVAAMLVRMAEQAQAVGPATNEENERFSLDVSTFNGAPRLRLGNFLDEEVCGTLDDGSECCVTVH